MLWAYKNNGIFFFFPKQGRVEVERGEWVDRWMRGWMDGSWMERVYK